MARKSARSAAAAKFAARVRMYCQGLGDCFLLTFPGKPKDFHVLIDCGVILGTPDPQALIRPVVNDILEVTNHKVDLLVATHEHWDHLSGFVQARDLFDELEVGEVWMGWTEDPKNSVAQKLAKDRADRIARAKKAAKAARIRFGANLGDLRPAIETLSFFGIDVDEDVDDNAFGATAGKGKPRAAAKKRKAGGTTTDALEWIRARAKAPRYLEPGKDVETLPGVDGVGVYVLGPPTDLRKLRKDGPTAKGNETFGLTEYEQALFAGIEDGTPHDKFRPFDPSYAIPLDQTVGIPFFDETYHAPDSAHRKIDDEWVAGLAEFALKLDSDTNNTSLVLAFELADGRVLLFPGDAQVGNWESWHDHVWKVGGKEVKAADLLDRTVLYKVGHHGSHNATLSTQGLLLMNRRDLVAMLPVDEYVAHEKKGWDRMPFIPLLEELGRRTEHRIVRPDGAAPRIDDDPHLPRVEVATTKLEAEVGVDADKKPIRGTRPLYVDLIFPMLGSPPR